MPYKMWFFKKAVNAFRSYSKTNIKFLTLFNDYTLVRNSKRKMLSVNIQL